MSLLETVRLKHQEAVDGLFGESSEALQQLADFCAAALVRKNKLLFCGNGGSACDAMHIAGEFVGRFVHDRKSLPAISLTADSGLITAIANDYGYVDIFSRQVEGLGQPGDVLVALSTSGQSPNVLKALASARQLGLKTALFTGEKGRARAAEADIVVIAPSLTTAHVQEAHMTALHALMGLIEAQLFPVA